MHEFIYLITERNNSDINITNCKIGFTTNIKKRIKQLQTANPNELVLLREYKATSRGRKLESLLHTHYKSKKINNEWFKLNSDDIKDFIVTCDEKQHIIELMEDNPFF